MIAGLVFMMLLAVLVARSSRGAAISIGAIFGLVLYLVNFYLFTAVFPWFAMARNWISVFSHIAFGLLAGWVYVAVRRSGLVGARAAEGLEKNFKVPGVSILER